MQLSPHIGWHVHVSRTLLSQKAPHNLYSPTLNPTMAAAQDEQQYQVGEFTVVKDWFVYSETEHNPHQFSAVGDNFGLEKTKSWASLRELLSAANESNSKSGSPVRYKLVYAARHGEGYHNVAEAKYSTAECDAKWALLTGDGEITWGPDPELTPLGENQARDVNRAWRKQLAAAEAQVDHAPLPTRLFSSPFKRSCRTLQLSYEGILLPPGTVPPGGSEKDAVPKPLIKEDLREQYGDDHEAVHRSNKSTIEKNFPHYEIEQGFTEEDERFKVRTSASNVQNPPLIMEGFRENFRDLHTCDQRSTKSVIAAYQPRWQFNHGFTEKDELFGVSRQTSHSHALCSAALRNWARLKASLLGDCTTG